MLGKYERHRWLACADSSAGNETAISDVAMLDSSSWWRCISVKMTAGGASCAASRACLPRSNNELFYGTSTVFAGFVGATQSEARKCFRSLGSLSWSDREQTSCRLDADISNAPSNDWRLRRRVTWEQAQEPLRASRWKHLVSMRG